MLRRGPFLAGVFLITFAVLVFQIVQTRILSVMAWYYLAFFAISVAMLGMTAGAVWVYLKHNRLAPETLTDTLADAAHFTAIAMPVSLLLQFSLITTLMPTLTSIVSWTLLMAAMTVPYVFAGVAVSLALTRSPFPVPLVYGVDLLGAALGCAAVIALLDVLDGPSVVLVAGLLSALAAVAFAAAAPRGQPTKTRALWRKPSVAAVILAALIPFNATLPVGFRPLMVKDRLETSLRDRYERWNSYSRVVAYPPSVSYPAMWGPSPDMPGDLLIEQVGLNIDGGAGTAMYRFDGTRESIDFLKYDVVNLAYHLPGIRKAAIIGVGGGRDLLSAHLFGVTDITGVELNGIFIDLHTRHPQFSAFSNLAAVPGLRLRVDDARSWFAASDESFDLIQMSLIDTWAATGAGAFSLSENSLYTLEGWRAFAARLTDTGVFTVSRWYNPGDVNESGRMIALALATVMDAGGKAPRRHVFVARTDTIASLILSKAPFTPEQLAMLRADAARLGFDVLVDPDSEPHSDVLRAMVTAGTWDALDRAASTESLDLTVPTDNRPFFFNQLRFRDIPHLIGQVRERALLDGVLRGNLTASITLMLILGIAIVAVILTILVPLRAAARSAPRAVIVAGTSYFALIGVGFMFGEISLLQYFGVFLGHPIYAMGVCLFSLILSTGIGSLASSRVPLTTSGRLVAWSLLVGGYLMVLQAVATDLFEMTTAESLAVRISLSLALVMPAGFLMGFAFPTGMALIERIDRAPTPWFWGINGAAGVLGSVLAVMVSMAFGINVTMLLAGMCYLLLMPFARALRQTAVRRVRL